MNRWVTLISFRYSHEPMVLRSKLDSEGIPNTLVNEYTTQMHHAALFSMEGVQLQVLLKDYNRAVEILEAAGLQPDRAELNPILRQLHILAQRIPFGRSWHPLTKIFVLVLSTLLIVVGTVVVAIAANSIEPEAKDYWEIRKELIATKALNGTSTMDSIVIYAPSEALSLIDNYDAPLSSEVKHNKGRALYHSGQIDLALEAFNSLRQQGNAALWYNIALCHAQLSNTDSASMYFMSSMEEVRYQAITNNGNSQIQIRGDFGYEKSLWVFQCWIQLGNLDYYEAPEMAATYYQKAIDKMQECEFLNQEGKEEREYAQQLQKQVFERIRSTTIVLY